MRVVGVILTLLGGIGVFNAADRAVTDLDIHSSFSVGYFFGLGFVPLLIMVGGLMLLNKSGWDRR